MRVKYIPQLADVKYPYCIGACLNVTATSNNVTYRVLTPTMLAEHYSSKGPSQAGTSLHITEVYEINLRLGSAFLCHFYRATLKNFSMFSARYLL